MTSRSHRWLWSQLILILCWYFVTVNSKKTGLSLVWWHMHLIPWETEAGTLWVPGQPSLHKVSSWIAWSTQWNPISPSPHYQPLAERERGASVRVLPTSSGVSRQRKSPATKTLVSHLCIVGPSSSCDQCTLRLRLSPRLCYCCCPHFSSLAEGPSLMECIFKETN